MIDVIVVGSGASGVHAAWPLVQQGLRVAMIDGGAKDNAYTPTMNEDDFRRRRRIDERQSEYLLGREFEGVPLGKLRVGAQLTPPRKHIADSARGFLRTKANNFQGMESLATGGLAAGWGAVSPPYTDTDIDDWPITRKDLQKHYEAVARLVGIAGAKDDLAAHMGPEIPLLKPALRDSNGEALCERYRERRKYFQDKGIVAGDPWIALASERFRSRGPCRYLDMEFWSDADRAVYRPVYTLEELMRSDNFEYLPGNVVRRYRETAKQVTVTLESMACGKVSRIRCRRMILAAGAIGSARIVLQSSATDQPLPLVSNPYVYYPCLIWPRLGQPTRDRRHSLTQFMLLYNPPGGGETLQGQFYSYRSLLTFKLVKESPLPRRESIQLMAALQPYFSILGVHHADRPHQGKRLSIADDTIKIDYRPSDRETASRRQSEKQLCRLLPKLGAIPLKRIDPGPGASIHYAGTLPMTEEDRPFTSTPEGVLRGGYGRVYTADGSALPSLPAKGLTLTLMANARRVAMKALRDSR